jgi:A/G-specific adenine glycosylase
VNTKDFQELIWRQGRELYRDMPWRQNTDPYHILVSELMLQQTQVDRVVPKFKQFIERFPTIQSLAGAPLADVLTIWSGLGYNRRAKFLHEAAKKARDTLPGTKDELMALPGVGVNTAGAILAYSFNQPVVFIETNIRTVYFHHFFGDQALVSDKELAKIVKETLDRDHPREWYWALMDYGNFLKKQGAGALDKSKHYKKQAPLKGSVREVRGLILKLLKTSDLTENELHQQLPQDERFAKALNGLLKDGLISRTAGRLHFTR